LIPGLYEATTWQYDTTEVEKVNADFTPGLGLEFEGAQLVDSESLCLTRGSDPIDNQLIVYVDTCVEYSGDITDIDNIAALKRQTWIIEHTAFTNTHYIIRGTCEAKAIKRFVNQETIDHSHQTICNQCRLQHFDLMYVDMT
jgi:hypothetical protein